MPHTIYHCGTAGEPTGEKSITIYTGSVLNYAVKLSPHAMAQYGVSAQEIEKFEKWFERQRHEIVKRLTALGVPYQYHVPHGENLEPGD